MNTFSRFVTIMVLLFLIPSVAVVFIVPEELIQLLHDGLDRLETWLDPAVSAEQMLLNVVAVVLIDFLLVLALYGQVRGIYVQRHGGRSTTGVKTGQLDEGGGFGSAGVDE